jgi:cell division protein FtsQ
MRSSLTGLASRMPKSSIDRSKVWRAVGLVVVGLLAVGALALVVAYKTSLFAVDDIEFTGNQTVTNEEALSQMSLVEGRPLLSVDESTLESRLEASPLIARADVMTDWQGTVSVRIFESIALVQAQTEGEEWAAIGDEGLVLKTSPEPLPSLPAVVGQTVSGEVGSALDPDSAPLLDAVKLLPESLRGRVVQVQMDTEGIKLGTSSGVIVVVGSTDRLAEKLTAAATVLDSENSGEIKTLDVRAPDLPVSTSDEVSEPSE